MDGTYRDDHEAAVARADALDRELSRVRAERDAACAERDLLRDRLARPRFDVLPPLPPLRRGASPASVAGGVSVLTVGLIATAVATIRLQPPPAPGAVLPLEMRADLAPAHVLANDMRLIPGVDDVVGCVELARGLDPSHGDVLAGSDPSLCASVIDSADARWSPASRQQLTATADALHALDRALEAALVHHDPTTTAATAHAVAVVREAAWRVDLSVVHGARGL
jgi:hypothetical protein